MGDVIAYLVCIALPALATELDLHGQGPGTHAKAFYGVYSQCPTAWDE